MSNNKQTFNHNPNQSSVDWVIGEILKHEMAFFGTASIPLYIIEQAKAKHKEECIKYYVDGVDYGDMGQHIRESLIQIAEKIYNETFGE